MKKTRIQTRAGTFTIVMAVKGPKRATPKQLTHALNVARNRVARAERRFMVIRDRRGKSLRVVKRKTARKSKARRAA